MKNTPEIQFLENLSDFGIKLGLDKTIFLLEKFKNPHFNYPSILIAGTNGKGSVAKTLSEILREAGYKTGLYISPHLVDIRERISINGKLIEEEDFKLKIREFKKILEKMPVHMYPTFFEAITVIAFKYFSDKKIDILVCEVGLGGKYDATNVLPSFMEIITKIGIEHTKYLGNTYREIAKEKAGIIKNRTTVISSKQKKQVEEVIKSVAERKKAKVYFYGKDFFSRRRQKGIKGQIFDFYGKENLRNIRTPFFGKYQIENISLAVQSALIIREKGFEIKKEDIYKGVGNVVWDARLQVLKEKPLIILDGAHNPDGIDSLLAVLKDVFPGRKFSFLVSILKDKNYEKMVKKISKVAEEIVFTKLFTERGIEPEKLLSIVKGKRKSRKFESVKEALNYIERTGRDWIICGSLYLAGEVLQNFKKEYI